MKIIQHICFGGCNWDAMMLWMYNNEKAPYIDVRKSNPNDICPGTPTRSRNVDSVSVTGFSENDKLANVYDLLGCLYDWGMEAYSNNFRMSRGGYYATDGAPGSRRECEPLFHGFNSTRAILYVQ